ncbi:MAG TPA: DUF2339 domain-containing protein [Thermoanaerobaculia bacterium]|nr:DUF2339 domain-containing protein [Thermoanaerobaculia bacterium]
MLLADRLASIERRLEQIEQRLGLTSPQPQQPPEPTPSAPPRAAPPPAARRPPPAPRPSASVESLIGAHWLNRIGIAALPVGVAFFLKYAFENEWIGPAARVGIGIVSGVALMIWSDRFHARGHRLFAHSLEVVAVGILYLSIWAASQTYALIPNGAAFIAMTVVTFALVALAIRHQSEFLAGLALTGGFLTPVLLSTGVNRQTALFTYITLLNIAALVLVSLYPWVRALIVAFFGTLFLYIGWYQSFYTRAQMPRTIAFASLFLLLFAVVPLLRRWQDRGAAAAVLLILPFANALVYFTQVSVMVQDSSRLAKYAVALAGFFLVVSFALQLRGAEEENLAAAHLAICLGFVTVAIPLQFHAVWITIGWLAEAAALLLLSRGLPGSGAQVFRILGSFSLGAAVFRLLFIERFHPEHLLLNMRALTYAIAVAVFSGIAISSERFRKFATASLNVLALIALTAEVMDFFSASKTQRDFTWSALWMLYGAGLMVVGFRRRNAFLRWLALILIGLTVFKVFLYDLSALERIYRVLSFLALGVLLLAISFVYQKKWFSASQSSSPDIP